MRYTLTLEIYDVLIAISRYNFLSKCTIIWPIPNINCNIESYNL